MAGDPRIRGEHEDKRYADWDRAGSSPHTRGALNEAALKTRQGGDHPRIRGEHAVGHLADVEAGGSSPHTRGARRWSPSQSTWSRIIPAYAGSTAGDGGADEGGGDHPRIRGEH